MARKLLKFLIMFDNPNLLYFPGQFVSGRVLVELDEDTPVTDGASERSYTRFGDEISAPNPKKGTHTLGSAEVSGLYLHVVGEGVIKVSDRRTSTTDKENYIDFRMRLLGEPGQGPVLLSPGIHSFPFKLGLPLGLPSTFLGKHGWVQYFCKAALREPNGLTHKNQQVFIVCNPIDLNLEPGILAQPFHCEMNPKLGMACLGAGEVKCRIRLDKGGYVPGETINIWANILNESKVTIKRTRACLSETIQYVAKSKIVQTESRELSSLSRGKIRPGEEEDWRGEHLYVPPLPPTNLRGCHIIRIQYDVFFILEPSSSAKEVKLQVPILLATYPFRNADGSLRRKQGTRYPSTLPILRPWLDEDKHSYVE